MKLLITMICIIAIFSLEVSFCVGFDSYRALILMRRGFENAFSGMGNSLITASRTTGRGCRRGLNNLLNFSFSLGYKDAEYHFYTEQQPRDRKADLLKKNLRHKMTYFEKEFRNGKVYIDQLTCLTYLI